MFWQKDLPYPRDPKPLEASSFPFEEEEEQNQADRRLRPGQSEGLGRLEERAGENGRYSGRSLEGAGASAEPTFRDHELDLQAQRWGVTGPQRGAQV